MRLTLNIAMLSILVSMALILHVVEAFIPIPFIVPGFKLGLANIVSVSSLCLFGFSKTLLVVLMRTFLGALLTGSISSFFYSIAGGILSLIVMNFAYTRFSRYFSLSGVSILGAVAHNTGQLIVASIIIDSLAVFTYLPFLLVSGIATGYFVGMVSGYLLKYVRNYRNF